MIQQESLKKRLAKLAAPIFIETLLIMMLGAVDTIMLSRHSDNSVAAVGVVNQIIMLTFLVFEVINLGTSVLCSQYLGAKLHKKVVQVVGVSILVNLAVGITVSLVLFSCAHPILRLMGLTAELMQDGMDYMRIVGAFAFFQALSITLSASLRSANKAIYPMMVTTLHVEFEAADRALTFVIGTANYRTVMNHISLAVVIEEEARVDAVNLLQIDRLAPAFGRIF